MQEQLEEPTEPIWQREYDAALVFADGTVFWGYGAGVKQTVFGEICFNTSITGYQEILTDPSYSKQIITFTHPHIGNVGANHFDVESQKAHAKGLVCRAQITKSSNYRAETEFTEWLQDNGLTAITGVDTREITRKIRDEGASNVSIVYADNPMEIDVCFMVEEVEKQPSMKGSELAGEVTGQSGFNKGEGLWNFEKNSYNKISKFEHKVVAIGYGEKLNILRHLTERGCDVQVVDAKTSAKDILKMKPDGIFLSNGPGDPAATAEYARETIEELLDADIPIFGICLGHQLLSTALGASTEKMHQGHRGGNHPVKNHKTNAVEITSQNHGFVVSHSGLPKDVQITHTSLFDGTIEGIRSKTKPAFSVQYHPESSPGPHDSAYLFDEFVALMSDEK